MLRKTLLDLLLRQERLLLDALPDWIGVLENGSCSGLDLISLLAKRFVDRLQNAACLVDVVVHLLCELNVLGRKLAELLYVLICKVVQSHVVRITLNL